MPDILLFEEVIKHSHKPEFINTELTLTLPFEKRQKSRFRAQLNTGEEVGVMIERGSVLRNDDCLKSKDGTTVKVISANEEVSTVHCDSAFDLARAAYHLGNRHVPLQVGSTWLRYLHDHVLDEMVKGFGLTVNYESAPFEPEIGAYHKGHGYSHGHHH